MADRGALSLSLPRTFAWTAVREAPLAILVILICAAQIALRSEDQNGTALAAVQNVLNNTGGDLSQYRPLSAYIAVGIQGLFGLSAPPFQAIRLVQALLLFSLAYVYYGQLRLHPRLRLVGIGLLTGLISLQLGTLGPNGFSLDRFFDAIFYLLGAVLILSSREVWLPALIGVAIANRETAVFMPVLLLARYPLASLLSAGQATGRTIGHSTQKDQVGGMRAPASPRTALVIALIAWIVAAVVYLAIHLHYGPHPRSEQSYWGSDMFLHSLSMPGQTAFFFAAINLLPLLALIGLEDADAFLQRLFWMIVPAWFALHIWAARLGEGLMYLAPLALIIVPMALQGLQRRLAHSAVPPVRAPEARLEATPAPAAPAGPLPVRGGR